MEIRTIVAFGMGIAGGAAGVWTLARSRQPGLIFQIEDRFFVQAAVVKAIAARAARVRTSKNTVEVLLVRRGVLQFRVAEFSVDVPRHGVLYLVSLLEEGPVAPSVRDVLIELAAYGLARPGLAFATRSAFERGQGRPLSFEIVPREVEVEREARRPSGSYFRVGDAYYADERFMERLENIPGAESDAAGRDVTIPIWKRGKLKFQAMGRAQMFPEQRGGLYQIKTELEGTLLEDYLTELVELGLVGWGGEWAEFPTHRSSHPPTGTPPWLPAGRVERRGDEEYLDTVTVAQMVTRLASQNFPDGSLRFLWRNHQIAVRPVDAAKRRFYAVKADEPGVQALLDELFLRRIAMRPERSSIDGPAHEPAVTPGQRTGHVYDAPSGLTYVDGWFAEHLLGRAQGATYETGRMQLRFGPVEMLVLTSVVHRTGPQLYFLFPDQDGELYEVDARSMPSPWQKLLEESIQSGAARRMPFPTMPPATRRTGHVYRTADSKEYIDGAGLIQVVRNAAGWSANNGGSLDVNLGRGSGGKTGHVVFHPLARRVGSAPLGLPDQAGEVYEATEPTNPDLWREVVERMIRSGDVVLRELASIEREDT